ncbi:MAG: uroporphyrinogen decarboxylase, partial [Gemmatimonadetes bacterium]|nr:uroporphyrinogen decarboxylase [Gemmatimonadota bacterium]
MNDLFLRACRSEPVDRVPVWMMRQAGRYLPEYRRVRERADFLTMCRTPELAVEVTMQPVDLVGVDAAIIFSDILVVPQAMGMGLSVDEGVGPVFHAPLRHEADLDTLRPVVPEEGLAYMLDALRLARRELDGRVPLIGFAGAPWTLAAYMVEGKGTKQWTKAKRLLVERPDVAHRLLGMLADAVGDFLVAQVEAGAQAVQVFDSWAAALGERDFAEFALPYLARVIDRVRPTG